MSDPSTDASSGKGQRTDRNILHWDADLRKLSEANESSKVSSFRLNVSLPHSVSKLARVSFIYRL